MASMDIRYSDTLPLTCYIAQLKASIPTHFGCAQQLQVPSSPKSQAIRQSDSSNNNHIPATRQTDCRPGQRGLLVTNLLTNLLMFAQSTEMFFYEEKKTP